MSRQRVLTIFGALLWLISLHAQTVPSLHFDITTNLAPASGRLFVVIAKSDRPEPRLSIGETGMDVPPVLARDVKNFGAGAVATIDKTAATFPIQTLDALPAGDYDVQALFDSNVDLGSVNAPGNRYSD